MNARLKFVAIGMLSAASVTLGAQAPQTSPTPQPPDNRQPTITQTPTRAQPANPTMTISGCLLQEKDVAGSNPNVAERAGVTEDYILTDVKMSPSSSLSVIQPRRARVRASPCHLNAPDDRRDGEERFPSRIAPGPATDR